MKKERNGVGTFVAILWKKMTMKIILMEKRHIEENDPLISSDDDTVIVMINILLGMRLKK